ncbi:hypothetical protein [Anoxybacillus eryuanensis]|uniref:hypothetical protein n=1 Tax=Anoxybacillus eryuanensis TaxID=651866 RepID=UPI003EF472FA
MNTDYWKGFSAGQAHERERAVQLVKLYIESLRDVRGVGDVLYNRIIQHVNTADIKEFAKKADEIVRKRGGR